MATISELYEELRMTTVYVESSYLRLIDMLVGRLKTQINSNNFDSANHVSSMLKFVINSYQETQELYKYNFRVSNPMCLDENNE